jgi:GT2 family glycosyltransferase
LFVKVSFIVPLFNCLPLTQAMVTSLQATVPGELAYEIILVDDGSTDGTRAWLATLPSPFRVVLNERNLGYAGANNRGAAVAKGEFLVLLNNDLVLTPRWLEPMLAAHRQLASKAGVVGNIQRDVLTGAVDHCGISVTPKAKPEHDRDLPPIWIRLLNPVKSVPAVTGACALVARNLWERLGGFDEGFSNGGEDVDFCFRAGADGLRNVVALRSVVRHHISASPGRKLRDEQNSRRLALKWRSQLERLALRRWCWDYLVRNWTTPNSALDHTAARSALLYALHLRPTPPAIAINGIRAAMDLELDRWAKLLP